MKVDDKINIRLIILSIFLALVAYAFAPGCITTRDCSKFVSFKQCSCIRGNGDYDRAKICHKAAFDKKRESMKKDCYRRCYDDCEKCEEI